MSVAMTTYNGERFLREQLESFAEQARLPDELVVCDDGSTDRTLEILEQFEQRAPFDVRIYQNDERLGHSKNFGRAIELCKGEIILLSDQDDVWFPKKLTRVKAEFLSENRPLVVINNCELADGELNPVGFTVVDQRQSAGLSIDSFASGCCLAMHASMKPLVIPVPADYCAYDKWIHRIAAALDRRRFVPEILQWYRRHGENTSEAFFNTTNPVRKVDYFWHAVCENSQISCRKRIKLMSIIAERLVSRGHLVEESLGETLAIEAALGRVGRVRSAAERRLKLLSHPRLIRLPGAFDLWRSGTYRYFSGWKSLAKDLVM